MSRISVAFLTPPANGQCNVHFAVIQHLLSLSSDKVSGAVDVHLLGTEPLRKKIPLSLLQPTSGSNNRLTFHCYGTSDYVADIAADMRKVSRGPPASLFGKGGRDALAGLPAFLFGPPDEFARHYNSLIVILKDIKPQVVIIDPIMVVLGIDVCTESGLPWAMISPGNSLETVLHAQPGGAGFWKYPSCASYDSPFSVS
jgi:hypothetical protein